jgi:basic membrane lipoprotein Med (substrate-binding protein (PBP1-ABC) superfamily)
MPCLSIGKKMGSPIKGQVKAYRPDIKVLESYMGSFTDVAEGKEAAMAMIDQKADVLSHVANQAGTGVIKAAESKGLLATGYSWDQHSIAPNTIFCSTIYNVPALVVNIVQLVKDGKNYQKDPHLPRALFGAIKTSTEGSTQELLVRLPIQSSLGLRGLPPHRS